MASNHCIILLLDESAGMGAVMGDVVADGTKSSKTNAERVATAVNSLLNQLSMIGAECDVALVGYRADASDQVDIGSRFGGSLTSRQFVPLKEIAAAPLRIETRNRKIPAPSGIGQPREETVNFPVWYSPTLGAKAPQIAAYNFCSELLGRWTGQAGGGTSLVIHLQSGSSSDGNPQMAVDKLLSLSTPARPLILLQIHLAATAQAVPALYPSNPQYLTVAASRDLFRRCSPVPDQFITWLKEAKVPVNKGAKALLYNAKIADVIRAFGWVKSYIQSLALATVTAPVVATAVGTAPSEPASATGSAAGDQRRALVALVLDRSVADPFGGNLQNSCARLQDHVNELLKQISKISQGTIDVALVSYGLDPAGHVDLRTTFEGPLAGRTIVPNSELADGALKIEEISEEVSNGVGGLVSVTRKKPIYCELEATAAASPTEPFAEVARLVSSWAAEHVACVPPIVLHLTRGAGDPKAIANSVASLREISTPAGAVVVYHLVATEAPHKSLAYPPSEADIDDPILRKIWDVTSPLLDRERLAAKSPAVSSDSRGIVINGKFDLLLDGVTTALTGSS